MSELLKILAVAIITVFATMLVKQVKPEIAILISIVGSIIIILMMVNSLTTIINSFYSIFKTKKQNRLVIASICILAIIILRTMTDTGIVYGHYYLGVIFWMYMSFVMYFIDRELPEKPKPIMAIVHDKIFKKKSEK